METFHPPRRRVAPFRTAAFDVEYVLGDEGHVIDQVIVVDEKTLRVTFAEKVRVFDQEQYRPLRLVTPG